MNRRREDSGRSARLGNDYIKELLGMLDKKRRKLPTQHEYDDFLESASTERDLWQEVVSNWPDKFEGELNKQFCDIVIFCSSHNEVEVEEFIKYLKDLAKPDTLTIELYGRNWKADAMIDNLDFFLFQTHISSPLLSCSSGLVFLSKEFCKCVWPELSSIDFFRNALYKKAKKLIFPVMPQDARSADFKIPMGLRQLTKIQYYKKDNTLENMLQKVLTTIRQRTKKLEEDHFTLQCKHIYDMYVLHLARDDIGGSNHVSTCESYREKLRKNSEDGDETQDQWFTRQRSVYSNHKVLSPAIGRRQYSESSLPRTNSEDGYESQDQVFSLQRSFSSNHKFPSATEGRRECFDRQVRYVGEDNVNKNPKLSVASNDFNHSDSIKDNCESISSLQSNSSVFDSANHTESEFVSESLKSSFVVKQGPVEMKGLHLPLPTAYAQNQEAYGRLSPPEIKNQHPQGSGHKYPPQQLNSPLHLPPNITLILEHVGTLQIGNDNKTENQNPPHEQTAVSILTNTNGQNNNSAKSKYEDGNSVLTRDCAPSTQNISSKSELYEFNLDLQKQKTEQEATLRSSQNPSNEIKIAALTPSMSDDTTWSLNENDDSDFSITHMKEVNKDSDEFLKENEHRHVKSTCVKRIQDSDMFSRENEQQNFDVSLTGSKRLSSGGVLEFDPKERMSQTNIGQVKSVKKSLSDYWSNENERKRKPLEQSKRNPVAVGLARPIRSNNVAPVMAAARVMVPAPVMVPTECSNNNNGCYDDDDDDSDIFNDLLPVDDNTTVKTVSFADETAVKDID